MALERGSLPDPAARLLQGSSPHACAIAPQQGLCAAFSQATLLVWRFWEGQQTSVVTHRLPYASSGPLYLHITTATGSEVTSLGLPEHRLVNSFHLSA